MSARQEILAAMPPGVWMATPDIKAATGYDCSKIHLILTGECKYKIVEKGPMIKHPKSTNNVVTWRKVARPTDEPPIDKSISTAEKSR